MKPEVKVGQKWSWIGETPDGGYLYEVTYVTPTNIGITWTDASGYSGGVVDYDMERWYGNFKLAEEAEPNLCPRCDEREIEPPDYLCGPCRGYQ